MGFVIPIDSTIIKSRLTDSGHTTADDDACKFKIIRKQIRINGCHLRTKLNTGGIIKKWPNHIISSQCQVTTKVDGGG